MSYYYYSKSGKTSRNVSQDQESDLSESWVTYNIDSDEGSSGFSVKEMERLLREAQRESGQSSLAGSSKAGSSPPGTPCNSLQSTPGNSGKVSPKNQTPGHSAYVSPKIMTPGHSGEASPKILTQGNSEEASPKILSPGQSGEASPRNPKNLRRTVPEMLGNSPGNTDWVWDWSSTPETQPRKNTNQFKRPKTSQINLSMRKTAAMKSGYFSWEFLQVFIPSMILTNLVAFGFGIYVGKRLTASKTA